MSESNGVLDAIEITEGVHAVPTAVRLLSPDELEAAGLPREFHTLTPQQKAAAVRVARGGDTTPAPVEESSLGSLGRQVPDSTERVNQVGGQPAENIPSFGLDGEGKLLTAETVNEATDAKQDVAPTEEISAGATEFSSDIPHSEDTATGSTDTPVDEPAEKSLASHTRAELNEIAADRGVADPESFPNKDELIAAIEKA